MSPPNPPAFLKNVSRETYARLDAYVSLLEKWQKRINLIAPSTVAEIWTRHVEDSFQCFDAASDARHWIDLGSGAGLPGMIVAILLADQSGGRVDFVESNQKKCSFLRSVARELNLQGKGVDIHIHCARIEDALRELPQPDVISARALASLNDLLGLTQGKLSKDTTAIFPKGREYLSEIVAAEKDWSFDCEVVASKLSSDSVILKLRNVVRK